jgi:plasmid stabilization system protein ParE
VKIEITEAAWSDLMAARDFYERQRPGLGAHFLDSLFSDIDSLLVYAGIHPVYFERFHRLLSKRFPFAVYYRLEGELARVYAVLDCRRDPDRTAERLS